jgi:hypothetical protein
MEVIVEACAIEASSVGFNAAEVAEFARATLTAKGRLRCDAAQLHMAAIRRGDEVCGLHFALRGPREVLLTAVWDASTGALWCYDSRGERFLTTQLPTGADSAEKMIDCPHPE